MSIAEAHVPKLFPSCCVQRKQRAGPLTHLVRALDAATGAKRWDYHPPPANGADFGGILATTSGLVFGTSEGGYETPSNRWQRGTALKFRRVDIAERSRTSGGAGGVAVTEPEPRTLRVPQAVALQQWRR
jgi:PQQ enzyme-like repeat protein